MKTNKYFVDGIIVVEGKSDVQFLETFIDATFVMTNGSEISSSTINYIKELKKEHRVIVLTDPDYPGNRIRAILNEHIDGLEHAFVAKECSIKHHKVGVAESTKEEVLKALKNVITTSKNQKETINMKDIISLGLTGKTNSSLLRQKICEHFNIGFCSTTKTFLKRLNSLSLTYDDLAIFLKGVDQNDC